VDSHQAFCAGRPDLVLPIDGAPLVFASELGHDFKLHLQTKGAGSPGIDLPSKVDPTQGGIVVDTRSIQPDTLDDNLTGTLHGYWGFQQLEGPSFHLRSAQQRGKWIVPSKDASALIVGRLDTLNLQSSQAACVENVSIRTPQGTTLGASWKQEKPDELQVGIPLENARPGSVYVLIKKFGNPNVDEVTIHTYAEAGSLESLKLHAGDTNGILKGTRLDQVKDVELKGLHFAPGSLSRAHQKDELTIVTKDPASSSLAAGEAINAQVTLKDGRVLRLNTTIDPPRPQVKVISKSVQVDPSTATATIKLGGADELPQEGRLSFSLKAQVPENFSPSEKIEIATLDESFHVFLTVGDGNLTMQDSKTELALLDPMRHLGPSAFGPLKMRPVLEDGTNGDWQPLINLVRIPVIRDVRCTALPNRQCTITGDKLFLIESVSTNPDFTDAEAVPEGFIEQTLVVPAAHGHALYLKLRDDPNAVDTMTWSSPPAASSAAPATSAAQ